MIRGGVGGRGTVMMVVLRVIALGCGGGADGGRSWWWIKYKCSP